MPSEKRDAALKSATIALAFFVSLLSVLAFVAVLSWTSWADLLSAMVSKRVIYAVELSLSTSLTSTGLAIATAVPVAYALSRHEFPGKGLVELVLTVPLILPPIAVGAILLVFFSSTAVGQVLESIFRIVFEIPGLVVAQYCVIMPITTKVVKASFDSLDPMYEGMAETLGCSPSQSLTRVLLPMSYNGIASAAVLGWSRAVGEFGASVMLAGATPLKTETLPISVFLKLSVADVPGAVALIVIMVGIAVLVLFGLQRTPASRYVLAGG
jgi:molybdate transport system permease protein